MGGVFHGVVWCCRSKFREFWGLFSERYLRFMNKVGPLIAAGGLDSFGLIQKYPKDQDNKYASARPAGS